jgi:hypothetical protein
MSWERGGASFVCLHHNGNNNLAAAQYHKDEEWRGVVNPITPGIYNSNDGK